MQIRVFLLEFDWNIFPGVWKSICQHWFRWWAKQALSLYLNQWWPSILTRVYVTQHQWVNFKINVTPLMKYRGKSGFVYHKTKDDDPHGRSKGCLRIILCMHPTDEIQCYSATPSLIGWAHIQNDPWISLVIIQVNIEHIIIAQHNK